MRECVSYIVTQGVFVSAGASWYWTHLGELPILTGRTLGRRCTGCRSGLVGVASTDAGTYGYDVAIAGTL